MRKTSHQMTTDFSSRRAGMNPVTGSLHSPVLPAMRVRPRDPAGAAVVLALRGAGPD